MQILKSILAGAMVLAVGGAGTASGTGPADTTAKVTATIGGNDVTLQRPEQIALMFMAGISHLEGDCVHHAGHACSMDELVKGLKTADGWGIGHLKFDPRTSDPNYTYTVIAGANKWEAKAAPRKAGMGGFYFTGTEHGFPKTFYNPKGEASATSTPLDGYSVDGDLFTEN